MEQLAAQIPKPRVNLVLSAGILAPHARHRALCVRYVRAERTLQEAQPGIQSRSEHAAWAELMRATFELDILACLKCRGRLRLIATILDPRIAAKLLRHLGARPGRRHKVLLAVPLCCGA